MRSHHLSPSGRWLPLLGLLLVGCGSQEGPALPPVLSSQPEVGTADSGSSGSRAPVLALVLPGSSTIETAMMPPLALREGGLLQAVIEVRRPSADQPASQQAELIRQAGRDGSSAVIVLVEDPEAVTAAIDEVQEQGVPVVALGKPISTRKPTHRVETVPYEAVTAKLVAAALDDAKAGNLPLEAPPLLLVRQSLRDTHVERRTQALVDALKAVGPEPIQVVFAVNEADAANALTAALKEHPGTSLVFAEGDFGLLGAAAVRSNRRQSSGPEAKFPLVVAGFTTDASEVDQAKRGLVSVVIDWNVVGMTRAAIRTALKLARGETVPELVEVPTPLTRSPSPTSTMPPEVKPVAETGTLREQPK